MYLFVLYIYLPLTVEAAQLLINLMVTEHRKGSRQRREGPSSLHFLGSHYRAVVK